MATLLGVDPVMKSTLEANDVASMICELGNVTVNGLAENAIKCVIVSVMVISAYVALVGTVTESEVEVVAVTVALTAPK
jgi:hypothetical protein